MFLFYRRSDADAANALLLDVLQREPLYQPALMRLSELRWRFGRFAEAIRYGEQALSLDPYSEWTRRILVRAYLDIQDPDAAVRTIEAAPRAIPVRLLPVRLYRHEWIPAADVTYAAEEDETLSTIDEVMAATALQVQARITGQYVRGISLLERMADVTWDAAGQPHLPRRLGVRTAAAALGDMLILTGERARARRLLEALLADMDNAQKALQSGALWCLHDRPLTLALLGDAEGAIRALQTGFADGSATPEWWLTFEVEPAYDSLRNDLRFKRLLVDSRAHAQQEHKALERLRMQGLVPIRAAARTK